MKQWKINSLIKRYKGGGSTTTVTESIPEWARPAIQDVQAEAKSKYEAGQLGQVAGLSTNQVSAFDMGEDIKEVGARGLGTLQDQSGRLTEMARTGGADELKAALDLDVGMGNAKIGQDYGASGTLGSYRQNLASASAEDATKAKFAQQIIQNRGAAETALGSNVGAQGSLTSGTASKLADLGNQERSVAQQLSDKDKMALESYAATVYGSPARQSATTTPGGK